MPPHVDIRSCNRALWIADRPFVSLWSTSYVLIVADAEHYIKRAVERFANRIPARLDADVKLLFRQEMAHANMHAAVSAKLAAAGYDFPRLLKLYRWLTFDVLENHIPDIVNLGIAAGVEHYNSTLAIQSLNDLSWYSRDGGIGDLLRWHYLEEVEHRTVVFDVMRSIPGPHWLCKLYGTIGFNLSWMDCWIFTIALARKEGLLFSGGFWRDAWRYFVGKRRITHGLGHLLNYLNPRFHPVRLGEAGL